MTQITVQSPAKINLTLDVVGTREDGYHLLHSVVHTVGIYDTIRFRFGGEGMRFKCDQVELCGDDNLCLKAARAWARAAHRVLDVEIALEKTVPTGAGLGGGSSNAATVLQTLNTYNDDALDDSALLEIATQLGADVPLFLRGEGFSDGCVLMEGIGEKLTPLRALSGWIVVVQPLQTLSTPQVFRKFDELNIQSNHATNRVLEAMQDGASLPQIVPLLSNDLTQAALSFVPQIDNIVISIYNAGAINALMTGSGSAVFCVCESEKSAHRVLKVVRGECELKFSAVTELNCCDIIV